MSASFGRDLRERLERVEQKRCPFTPRPPGWLGRNAHWVKPVHVVEVDFAEWTAGGHIRHPSLKGFREDKAPRDVVRETPRPSAEARSVGKSPLMFATARLTRADVVEAYARIADWVLPHVQSRPLTIVRCRAPVRSSDALRTQCVFVRHTARDNAWAPDSLPRVRIPEQKKVGEYLYVESAADLLSLIEHGAVEWHVWNARVDDVERPDRIVFDLDPGARVAWTAVVKAARRVRDALASVGLECWLKTTGGDGVHVVVPFRRGPSWDAVFEFSRTVAVAIAESDPDAYTTSFARARRAGKVLIDYKRNHRASIAVAGFSTRARPGAPISMPVAWRELTSRLRPEQFRVPTIAARLARVARRGDPWSEFWTCDQRLPVRS